MPNRYLLQNTATTINSYTMYSSAGVPKTGAAATSVTIYCIKNGVLDSTNATAGAVTWTSLAGGMYSIAAQATMSDVIGQLNFVFSFQNTTFAYSECLVVGRSLYDVWMASSTFQAVNIQQVLGTSTVATFDAIYTMEASTLTSIQTAVDAIAGSITSANILAQVNSALTTQQDIVQASEVGSMTSVFNQAASALVGINLDHLVYTQASTLGNFVASQSIVHQMMATSDISLYSPLTHSLQGIAQGAAGGGATQAEVLAQVESALTTRQDIAQGSDLTSIAAGASAISVLAQVNSALTTQQGIAQTSMLTSVRTALYAEVASVTLVNIAANVATTLVTQGFMQASMSTSIVSGVAAVSGSVQTGMYTYAVASVPSIAAHVATTLVTQGNMQASMSTSIVSGIAAVSGSVQTGLYTYAVASVPSIAAHVATTLVTQGVMQASMSSSIITGINAFNASMTLSNVKVQAASALESINLDHLVYTQASVLGSFVASQSIVHQMMATSNISLYDPTVHSLQGIGAGAAGGGASQAEVLAQIESALTTRQDIAQASDLAALNGISALDVLTQINSALTTQQDVAQASDLTTIAAGASAISVLAQVNSALTTQQGIAQTSMLTSVRTALYAQVATVTLANITTGVATALGTYNVASYGSIVAQALSALTTQYGAAQTSMLTSVRTALYAEVTSVTLANITAGVATALGTYQAASYLSVLAQANSALTTQQGIMQASTFTNTNIASTAGVLAQVTSALTTGQDVAQGSDLTTLNAASTAGVLAQIESALTTRQDIAQGSEVSNLSPLQASAAFNTLWVSSALTDVPDSSYITAAASIVPQTAIMGLFDRMFRAVEQSSTYQHVYNAASVVIATQQVTEADVSSRGPAA